MTSAREIALLRQVDARAFYALARVNLADARHHLGALARFDGWRRSAWLLEVVDCLLRAHHWRALAREARRTP